MSNVQDGAKASRAGPWLAAPDRAAGLGKAAEREPHRPVGTPGALQLPVAPQPPVAPEMDEDADSGGRLLLPRGAAPQGRKSLFRR